MQQHVAVIGAGIAGLAAAQALVATGCLVTVFDKSRGVGGRMATRRIGDYAFDHGAQFVTTKSVPFANVVTGWRHEGAAAEWPNAGMVGVPDMASPARALAAGLSVVLGCTVVGLSRASGSWSLSSLEHPLAAPAHGFDAVILAIPAPQAAALLHRSCVAHSGIGHVRFHPCWTLMAAFETLLYRYSGQEEFIVSTAIANRTQKETEPLIGCLINILLL